MRKRSSWHFISRNARKSTTTGSSVRKNSKTKSLNSSTKKEKFKISLRITSWLLMSTNKSKYRKKEVSFLCVCLNLLLMYSWIGSNTYCFRIKTSRASWRKMLKLLLSSLKINIGLKLGSSRQMFDHLKSQ